MSHLGIFDPFWPFICCIVQGYKHPLARGAQEGPKRVPKRVKIGPKWVILGHFEGPNAENALFWPFLVHFLHWDPKMGHFGSFWVILGHFGSFWGHFGSFWPHTLQYSIGGLNPLSKGPKRVKIGPKWVILGPFQCTEDTESPK